MKKNKLLKTYEIFDSYEKRFAKARLDKQFCIPTDKESRCKIIEKTKKMLGYDECLVPKVSNMEEVSRENFGTHFVIQLRYTTWENTYSCATLYLPNSDEKLPLVFLVCGHGDGGRLFYGYRSMAHKLCAGGFAVIVPDNIGQGDREFMGHWNSVGPFYAGYTLQGLIVMETVALVRYMTGDSRFDPKRFAAIGNSGGGTLTLFLAALCPEISVLASSGYPSEFHYVLEKERSHCSCNLLRGCAVSVEMWEIYSIFAPKPMLVEQGIFDNLIPVEYFERNSRKVRGVYSLMGAEENFESHVAMTKHPWDAEDKDAIVAFLAKRLGISNESSVEFEDLGEAIPDSWHVTMPTYALNTDELSERLSGRKMPDGTSLADIFKPSLDGEEINEAEILGDVGRGSVMKVFAQMECALLE